MQFLVKIVKDCESSGIFRTQQNIKIELFAENVNSFQLFILFVKSTILDVLNMFWILNTILNTSLEVLTTFARSFIWDFWLGFRYLSDIKKYFQLGETTPVTYIEWLVLRGDLQESCFGNLILSQIHNRNILSQ